MVATRALSFLAYVEVLILVCVVFLQVVHRHGHDR